jgi:hypothetical protein
MAGLSEGKLGLVVCSAPWMGRSNREQLDFALAAAALGLELELFFIGAGLEQLLGERQGDPDAGLPAGHRAWAALEGVTEVCAWGEAQRLAELSGQGNTYLLPLKPLEPGGMHDRLAACARVLVL